MTNFGYGPGTGFTDAMRYGSLLVQARFTVLQGGIATGSPYYANLSTGTVTIDRNSEFRRSGEITLEVIPSVPSPALMPVTPDSLISPFGTEIFLETGITAISGVIPDASPQWIPNGTFAVATTTVNDTGVDCTITVQLYDRSWTISQRALRNPWNFPATATGNFMQEIQLLLNTVWNEQQGVQPLQYNIVPTSAVVPTASYDQGSDPWQAAVDMASAIGYELFFDVNGVVVGQPIADPTTIQPTWNFTDDTQFVQGLSGTGSTALFGDAYSTPVEVSVSMTRDQVYNDIIVQGTGTANAAVYNGNGLETTPQPLLAEAADTNPISPTYILGPMGDVPNFIQSSLVTTNGAQSMANNELRQTLSSAWKVTLGASPNPIFDAGQVIIVTRPRVGLINAVVVLDTITHVFNYADIMYLTGRVLDNDFVASQPPVP